MLEPGLDPTLVHVASGREDPLPRVERRIREGLEKPVRLSRPPAGHRERHRARRLVCHVDRDPRCILGTTRGFVAGEGSLHGLGRIVGAARPPRSVAEQLEIVGR